MLPQLPIDVWREIEKYRIVINPSRHSVANLSIKGNLKGLLWYYKYKPKSLHHKIQKLLKHAVKNGHLDGFTR